MGYVVFWARQFILASVSLLDLGLNLNFKIAHVGNRYCYSIVSSMWCLLIRQQSTRIELWQNYTKFLVCYTGGNILLSLKVGFATITDCYKSESVDYSNSLSSSLPTYHCYRGHRVTMRSAQVGIFHSWIRNHSLLGTHAPAKWYGADNRWYTLFVHSCRSVCHDYLSSAEAHINYQ